MSDWSKESDDLFAQARGDLTPSAADAERVHRALMAKIGGVGAGAAALAVTKTAVGAKATASLAPAAGGALTIGKVVGSLLTMKGLISLGAIVVVTGASVTAVHSLRTPATHATVVVPASTVVAIVAPQSPTPPTLGIQPSLGDSNNSNTVSADALTVERAAEPKKTVDLPHNHLAPSERSHPSDPTFAAKDTDVPPPVTVATPASSATTADSASTLAPELALLKRIHAALGTKDWAQVLRLTSDHDAHFPGGAFSEESAAARTIALCTLHSSGASSASESFRRAYPHSPQLSRITDSCKP